MLCAYLGIAYMNNQQYDNAFIMYDEAESINPNNPFPAYQRANALLQLQRYDDALNQLQLLLTIAPTEASIYYLIGKIYYIKKLYNQTILYWTKAMDFDVKQNLQIKHLIEKVYTQQNNNNNDNIDNTYRDL